MNKLRIKSTYGGQEDYIAKGYIEFNHADKTATFFNIATKTYIKIPIDEIESIAHIPNKD